MKKIIIVTGASSGMGVCFASQLARESADFALSSKESERFYRSDESRNRATGGYGLGLAIAKSIIDNHKFKLHVMNQPGKSVCFMISM